MTGANCKFTIKMDFLEADRYLIMFFNNQSKHSSVGKVLVVHAYTVLRKGGCNFWSWTLSKPVGLKS